MSDLNPTSPKPIQVVPAGQLRKLFPDEVKPSANNPRRLFDDAPMAELKKNIAEHGVLVPITVYQKKGDSKFSILDGERRYRCVSQLNKEGHKAKDGGPLKIPANIVEPPDKIAGLIYMFSIHNFREGWELMPTALSLDIVMKTLGETDTGTLSKFTGLSDAQVERCKKLLAIPKHFQDMSLDPNPKTRIPSNFWIEAAPVLDIAVEKVPTLTELGRERSTLKLVEKYRNKKIKSVIHFRRIMQAYEVTEDSPLHDEVLSQIEAFFLRPDLETRAVFDRYIAGIRSVDRATTYCTEFVERMTKLKLRYLGEESERRELSEKLAEVKDYCTKLTLMLQGSDDPEIPRD